MVLTELECSDPLFNQSDYSRIIFEPTGLNCYGLAFKKGNDAAAQKFSDALRKLYEDGRLKQNVYDYYGDNTKQADSTWEVLDGDWLLK